ncbi:MAG: sterol desaturase family protein [Alcanivorax sp.]|jgi:sterol desaturase/sphingolipid hydroxylase (fatty acid hydroxylase superfamily)|nr:sterol desaturase family protein [Alcanivorax sp.]|tara:strand:+ start:1434 stop:2441 length:1008 start_codon:yes stop_codon:yes gene_type:complete
MQDFIAWVSAHIAPWFGWMQIVLILGLPAFLLSFGFEWAGVRYRSGSWQASSPGQRFYWKEVLANLTLGQGYYVFEFLMHLAFLGAGMALVWQHRLFTVDINAWTLPLIFLVEELCYYTYHRSAHRVRWFWAQHVSHHTGEVMNLTTAGRQSILNGIVGVWLFFIPPILLGVHPAVITAMLGLNLAFQWFVHTETVPRLHPVLEWLFNTPSNHRVHHGRNPQYIDKNYGGVLMIYDHLFGTYEPEVEKVEYGTTRQIKSYNWFVLNLHEFVDMWRDALAPGSLWQRLKHFWMPPEWERPGHTPIHTWTIERKGGAQTEPRQPKQGSSSIEINEAV